MNYIGSKTRLLPFIFETIQTEISHPLSELTFCDLFAGSSSVSRFFSSKVSRLIVNDREFYSYVLSKGYFSRVNWDDYFHWINVLNEIKGVQGFIFNQYSENGSAGRLYFSAANGQKIDAVRIKIDYLRRKHQISEEMYYLLLATVLMAMDKVSNTASVYCAYLKQLKKSALKNMVLQPIINKDQNGEGFCEREIFMQDSSSLIKNIKGDILYLDPPYNGREYGSYYHLLNTVSQYDQDFSPKGIAGLRAYDTSQFCRRSTAEQALEELLTKADFTYIFLSYNNEGIISKNRIEILMRSLGSYKIRSLRYPRFVSQRYKVKSDVTENIHILFKK